MVMTLKTTYRLGNVLTVLGCLCLVLGVVGLYDMDVLSFGLSSGVRVIGTFAILGCLLSAIGYGVIDFLKLNDS